MQYHVHIVTFLHICDQNLLIHVPVYIALCFVIKVLIFKYFVEREHMYGRLRLLINLHNMCPKLENFKYC